MPFYEYRCPKGHTFEVFHKMTDEPVAACEVCGASPVEKILFPVAVHYKGSGFYSTDYGRGGRKATGKDGDGGGVGKLGRLVGEEGVEVRRARGEEGPAEEVLERLTRASRQAGIDAAQRVSPTRQPGAYGNPFGGASGEERPVNIATVATLSSEPRMTDSPRRSPGRHRDGSEVPCRCQRARMSNRAG